MSGYTNLNPGINVESISFFSASFAKSEIAPVSAVTVSGIPSDNFGISVKISCSYKDNDIFSLEGDFSKLNGRMYGTDGTRLLIRFNFDGFKINYGFLETLEEAFSTEIVTNVSIDGSVYEMRNPVTITAANEFAGIEAHPETLAAFVSTESSVIAAITEGCKRANEWTSLSEAYEIAGEIMANIRAMNIVCVKRDGYSPEKRQVITPADKLYGKSSVVTVPLELALLFCSALEKCGLDSAVVFVKNTMGIVSLYCGVIVRKELSYTISESMTMIRKAIADGEMFFIDPAVLSSAQLLDIEHSAFLASEVLNKAGTDMILSVGLSKILRDVIGKSIPSDKKDARALLAEIYSGLSSRKGFKLLSGEYDAFDVVPLMGADGVFDGATTVRPMEISEKISDFKDVSDNYAAFAFRELKPKEHNKTEFIEITRSFEEFKRRISSKKYITAGLYEKVFHERISRMCHGGKPGMKNYIICGFMRMTEAKTNETLYFPLSFSEVEIGCDYDYFFKEKDRSLIVNAVLASFLSASDSSLVGADSTAKVFELFENLAEVARKNAEYSEVCVIREYALINADLSDGVLWNDLRRNGKHMLSGGSFAELLSEKAKNVEDNQTLQFTFPRFMPYDLQKKSVFEGNAVISGSGIKEMSDVAVNKAVYSVSQGKKTVVASVFDDFNNEIYGELEKEGFTELMLRLDRRMTTEELCSIILKRAELISETVINPSSDILTEYDKTNERLKAYHAAMSVQDGVLGITVPDGILSYFRACDTEDNTDFKILNVNKNAFYDMTRRKFNMLFERAESLVEHCAKSLDATGLPRSTALKNHPLYPVKKNCVVDEKTMSELFETVTKINAVIADYRETFYDVSPLIGINMEDVKNLDGLLALNELYRLVISARELEIPEGVSGSDITSFADDANKLKNELGRAQNIEYRLRFFGNEVFEDVDMLLSGYSSSESGKGSFIKKFLVKKNNKDVLLQYVPDENRNEFNQQNVEEIYKLLEEYRQIKESTAITDSYLGKENSVKLAEMIKSAQGLFEKIYPGISSDEQALSGKIGRLCGFVKKVSSDAALSKKLTYARAKFALAYSENECLFDSLSEKLNADFSVLNFDCGILDYDGIGRYLKELEKNLPALEYWNGYIDAKKAADEYMPEFSEYIEEYGIKANTDRVFAASLILPAIGYLIDKYDIIKHKKNYDGIKGKYFEMYRKARSLSSANALISYRQRLKHYTETENFGEMVKDTELSLYAFVNKYKKAILNMFPIVFADAYSFGYMFGGEETADVLMAGMVENSENVLLSCASAAKSVFLVKYCSENGILSRKLHASGASFTDVSYALHSSDRTLGSLIGIKEHFGFDSEKATVALLTVNGTMRRVHDGANAAEAETCVSKAGEIYGKTGKTVGIFSLTSGQAAFIRHLLNLSCESDKKFAEGVENGCVKVFGPSEVCFEKFDVVFVSIGAAVDKNGSIGWSFGCGGNDKMIPALVSAFNSVKEKTIIVCSLTVKEITKLRKSSYEAEKLFFTLLSASGGLVCADIRDKNEYKNGLSYMMLADNESLVPAKGLFASVADGYDMNDSRLYMYDCDINGNVFDRLYQAELLESLGIGYVSVPLLEDVLKKLGRE